MRTHHLFLFDRPSFLGLSVIDWILPIHGSEAASHLTQKECRIIHDLTQAVTKAGFSFPTLMDPYWKDLLSDEYISDGFRNFFFTLIEMIHVKSVSGYEENIDVDRDAFFEYGDLLAQAMNTNTPKSSFEDLFSGVFDMKKYILIDDLDTAVWTLPFSAITSKEGLNCDDTGTDVE
jgi:hypothetical protein